MKRRSFLRSLLLGAAGVALAEGVDLDRLLWRKGEKTYFLPSGTGLRFNPKAFGRAFDEPSGMGIRFIKQYDVRTDQAPTRLDCLYGVRVLTPEFAVHVEDGDGFSVPTDGDPVIAAPRQNTLITLDWLTHEMLRSLENNLTLTKAISRHHEDVFAGTVIRTAMGRRG